MWKLLSGMLVPLVLLGVLPDSAAGQNFSVAPDGQALQAFANTSGQSAVFIVHNYTQTSTVVNLNPCIRTGNVTSCSSPSSVFVQSQQNANVTVTFATGAVGSGTLALNLQSLEDGGSFNVSVVAGNTVTVTPDNSAAGQLDPYTGGYSAPFTVTNTASTGYNTFAFSCSGQSGVACGVVPGAVTLAAGGQVTVSMPYSVGAPGSGTLSLTATGTGAVDAGSYNMQIGGIKVTPVTATSVQRLSNHSGYSETFTVLNTGISTSVTFQCFGVGGIICGTVPAPINLGTGAQSVVSMPYSTGTAGVGTLIFLASGSTTSGQGTYTIPVGTFGVAVIPDGDTSGVRYSSTTGYGEAFIVQNIGDANNTFSFTCGATGGLSCGTVPSPVTLGPIASDTVTMPYTTGSGGLGTLTLTATGTGASNAGYYNVPVIPNLSWVSGGLFAKDSRMQLYETANTYDAQGAITQLTDARGIVTNFQYGGNPNNAFLTKVTKVHDGTGAIDLVTDIVYNGDQQIQSIKDPAGTFRYFSWDLFGRLLQVRNNGNQSIKGYSYAYSRTNGNGWVFQPASPNAVTDSTYVQLTPSLQAVVNTVYVDGIGREIQAVAQDGANYHVTAAQFDLAGRPWRKWKPYTRAVAGFDPSFSANAASWYTTYHGTTATPYTETLYRPDALNRVSKVFPEYLGTSRDSALTGYGFDGVNKLQFSEAVDEAGKKRRSYQDALGYPVKSVLGQGAPEAATTVFLNDIRGKRTQVTDPRGLIISYSLDTRGLLTSRTSPDAGTTATKYDKVGKPRFSQDANQAAGGQVFFTNYDFAGRPLTSGLGAATFGSLDPDLSAAFEATQGNWLVVQAYDAKPGVGAFPWSLFSSQITGTTLTNVAGRLAAVASKSGSAWQVTLISYNADGQIAARYIYTQNNPGTNVMAAATTIDSVTRDLRGKATYRKVMIGGNPSYQWYDYDGRGLLFKLYAATTATKPANAVLTDTYRPSRLTASYQFNNGPLVPITYTVRELTEKIGDPALTTYPFSGRYAYNSNGTVNQSEFYNGGSPATQKRYRYDYGTNYDALNRLKSADFSSWNGSGWTPTLAYDIAGIGYDADGNLTGLQRYKDNASLIDNLTYTYPGTSNRLSSVTDAVSTTAETWDAETGSFTYDANGNVLTAPAPYSITAMTYDHRNLPTSITKGGVATVYRYDGAGQRITKKVGSGNNEVYLLDGQTTLGVVTINSAGSAVSWYFNLLWEDRVVGRQPNTGSRSFYHFDILGSPRTVVQGATIVEGYDYDPWGLLMPARYTVAGTTKERFTGKEQDSETGLGYFGARHYMPALGRWTTVDPLADSMPDWSPYNYVYDNPVGLIDPDGRQANQTCIGNTVNHIGCRDQGREAEINADRATSDTKRNQSAVPKLAKPPEVTFNSPTMPSMYTVTREYAPLTQEQSDYVHNEMHDQQLVDGILTGVAVTIATRNAKLSTQIAAGVIAGYVAGGKDPYIPRPGDQITMTQTGGTCCSAVVSRTFVVKRADGSTVSYDNWQWSPK